MSEQLNHSYDRGYATIIVVFNRAARKPSDKPEERTCTNLSGSISSNGNSCPPSLVLLA